MITLVSNADAVEAPGEDAPADPATPDAATPDAAPSQLLAAGGASGLARDLADGLRPLAKSTIGAMSFLFSPGQNRDAEGQASGEDKTL